MPMVVATERVVEGGDLIAVNFLADVGVVGVFFAFDGLEFTVFFFLEIAFGNVAETAEFDTDTFTVHGLVSNA